MGLSHLKYKIKYNRHCSLIDDDKEVMFYTEPYDVNKENITELIKYCDKRGLTFRINGQSSHYPGRCLRIGIFPVNINFQALPG